MPDTILTRDLSSGRIHRRFLAPDGSYATLESDNLDEAGDFEVVTADALEQAEPGTLCERCFPDVGAA